jgi:creatinine amidohydrolase/Fe(II)-dependent formamide hydrolase-like protein
MLLAMSTWPQIDAWLKHCRTVVIPIGSNEQHGPTGLLGTDWLCPEIIAHEADRRSGELLVAPTFNIGMAQHHLGFPGTISLRPSTFQAALCDWIQSLTRQGFQRLYFFNGHGGNTASIEAAFSEVYSRFSLATEVCPFALKLRSWWQLPGLSELTAQLFPSGHGSHATPSEISITLCAYPDTVKQSTCTPTVAPTGPVRDAVDFRARFHDGRIGSDPSQASAAAGAALIDAAVVGLLADVEQFTTEPPLR